jgi:hypothetical protein
VFACDVDKESNQAGIKPYGIVSNHSTQQSITAYVNRHTNTWAHACVCAPTAAMHTRVQTDMCVRTCTDSYSYLPASPPIRSLTPSRATSLAQHSIWACAHVNTVFGLAPMAPAPPPLCLEMVAPMSGERKRNTHSTWDCPSWGGRVTARANKMCADDVRRVCVCERGGGRRYESMTATEQHINAYLLVLVGLGLPKGEGLRWRRRCCI